MDKNDFLTYKELQEAIENDTTDNNFKICAEFLLEAVSDWPAYNSKEPKDLIIDLKNEIKDRLTFENLDKYYKTLTTDEDDWKMTAVSSLYEMFDFNRKNIFDMTIELETIITRLTEHYKQQNGRP